jgi:hypothetical protein
LPAKASQQTHLDHTPQGRGTGLSEAYFLLLTEKANLLAGVLQQLHACSWMFAQFPPRFGFGEDGFQGQEFGVDRRPWGFPGVLAELLPLFQVPGRDLVQPLRSYESDEPGQSVLDSTDRQWFTVGRDPEEIVLDKRIKPGALPYFSRVQAGFEHRGFLPGELFFCHAAGHRTEGPRVACAVVIKIIVSTLAA